MSRIPPVDPTQMNAEQRKVYDAIASGPRGGVRGPFLALLHVPELANRVGNLGELLRYKTSLGQRLSELAIITVARNLRCHYEWYAHSKIALDNGVPPAVVEAIRTGKTPEWTDPKDRLVYEFTRELIAERRVSDATYQAAAKAFGTAGVVELAGLVGYYSMIAMTLNAHEIVPPELPFSD